MSVWEIMDATLARSGMWDAQTNRFYYAMDVSVSATTMAPL